MYTRLSRGDLKLKMTKFLGFSNDNKSMGPACLLSDIINVITRNYQLFII